MRKPLPPGDVLGGRRAHSRVRLLVPATVETLHGVQTGTIKSISRGGATLSLSPLPPSGTGVLLSCGRIQTYGKVVWCRRRECGVRFAEPLSEEYVLWAREAVDQLAAASL